jgi:pyridoxine 5-phosphate synthase
MAKNRLRLGINIDHVATIRNARGAEHPSPLRAAKIAAASGADGITAHLREDRRHITEADIENLKNEIDLPLNLEMAATPEMLAIALKTRPHAACIVPEKRQEVTTEGGLDAARLKTQLEKYVGSLSAAGIRVSLFIEAAPEQLHAAKELGAHIVELHTGAYAHGKKGEYGRIIEATKLAETLGLECHAGHGLNYDNVGRIAAIPTIRELNIGHFLIGEAIFEGLGKTIKKMRNLMDEARK